MERFLRVAAAAFFISCVGSLAFAGEQGHYSPAPIAVRDYSMPPKGFYVLNYDTFYEADEFRDSGGDKLDSLSSTGSATRYLTIGSHNVPIALTGTLTANIQPDVKAFVQSPAFAWVTDKKILGADYAFIIAPSWGLGADAKLRLKSRFVMEPTRNSD
jgi:hypothetical protein